MFPGMIQERKDIFFLKIEFCPYAVGSVISVTS